MRHLGSVLLTLSLLLSTARAQQPPDLILHGGKIATVDDEFRIAEAIAIAGERIVAVGTDGEVLKLRGDDTNVVDLAGKLVLPGLMDSHTHSGGAAMTEFDHELPDMHSVEDVLDYIESRTRAVPEGEWIAVRQVFITRLRERRYPTRAELDRVAPKHPVVFSTGPDAAVNSLALSTSGIDKDFRVVGSGQIERDPVTGEPTGILRGGTQRYLKGSPPTREATAEDRARRLAQLLADYNSVGITSIGDRSTSESDLARYAALLEQGKLTVRVAASYRVETSGELDEVISQIDRVAKHPLRRDDPMLRVIGIKTFLDGGMLTGSAYMRQPWGVSEIYSIRDPDYRGVLFIPPERLVPIVRATIERKLQFTAHSVGDGAVHTLLDAYEQVSREMPIRETRPCITHSNFMSHEAVETMARLGVVADIQPAWLYLDTGTLVAQFGYDRLRYFQPLRTIFEQDVIAGGGSDHMQKIGSLRSINPYNPFLGMWVTIARQARNFDRPLHPQEALSREQAIRFYTANNAYLLFHEHRTGTLEIGKLADLIVLDRDILTCPVDDIRDTKVLSTYLGGRLVYSAEQPAE
ncbi:MAG: amidohydrolase [Pirellulales bacterium]